MEKLTFNKTHRVLQKATANNDYATIEIDASNGLYKKVQVDSKDTLIRVGSNIFGETFKLGKPKELTVKQLKQLQSEFNAVRAERDWEPIEFRISKEISKVNNEMSSSPEIQRQEEAETV